MLRIGEGISEIAVLLPDNADPDPVAERLRAMLPDRYEIHTWRDLLPMLTAYIEMNDGFTVVWYLVVFIAMGFGIVNTLLMAGVRAHAGVRAGQGPGNETRVDRGGGADGIRIYSDPGHGGGKCGGPLCRRGPG